MICIAAGHQVRGSGACGLIDEASEVYQLTQDIVNALRTKGKEVCTDTPEMSLSEVTKLFNSKIYHGKTFAVELHFNCSIDSRANGTECIISNTCSVKSMYLAKLMADTICKILKTRKRGYQGYKHVREIGRGSLWFVDRTACPSCIVEICFCSSTSDIRKYSENRSLLVTNIANALCDYEKNFDCLDRLFVGNSDELQQG